MQYKLKDKKISIWKLGTQKVNGVNVTKYTPVVEGKIWAFYQQIAGGGASLTDVNGLQVYDSTERAQFVINNRSDVNLEVGDLVVFREKFYNIIIVDDYQGYNEDIKLTAELAESQNAENYTDKGVVL